MSDTVLTLHEAAAQLGVHYMTAYRYVRLGALRAIKVGGSWQVTQADLEAFERASAAGEPAEHGGRPRARWDDRFESRLLAGDAAGAWGVVEAALAAGTEADEVYTEVMSPALTSIGQRWERGELDVAIEHRASGIVMRLIGRLGPRFARRGRTRGGVLIGAPEGERHAIPVAMLADLVRADGWDVSDLGVDVPESSFVHAVVHTPELVALGVSVTTAGHLEAARRALAAARAVAPGLLLVIGGAAVREGVAASELGADAVATDANGFLSLLAEAAATPRFSSVHTFD